MGTSDSSRTRGKHPALKAKGGKGRPGAVETYWVSLAAKEEAPPFAETGEGGKPPALTEKGRMLAACWRNLGKGRPSLETDALSIGPRLVQGILRIRPGGEDPLTLSGAVRLFKVLSTHSLAGGSAPASTVWKKGYAERPLATLKQVVEARGALKSRG